ncbi:MAG: hypothetical protein EPO23_07905 [Xanthobacteraceae bacterium]|nr:MAG: hypothetical protein EPO23_07905 [Xanthobacteraceae bacterium]
MCRQAISGQFDPNECPLLQGLSPDEQYRRMRTDPLIRACIATHCITLTAPVSFATAKKPRKRRGAAGPPLSCLNPAPAT